MSRTEELQSELERAPGEIVALLADGPMLTADLIEGLGHSIVDVALSRWIGDNGCEWDGSPHQLALSDLVDSAEVQWRYDDELNVWYGLKGTWPKDECGDDSPAVTRISRFLDDVASRLGESEYDQGDTQPDPEGAEDETCSECRSVHCNGKVVEVIDADFVVGGGGFDPPDATFPWPDCEAYPDKVAEAVRKAIGVL